MFSLTMIELAVPAGMCLRGDFGSREESYVKIEGITADWDPEKRDKILTMWMNMLRKPVSPVQNQDAAQDLKELEDKSH